ncbi:netrin receptor unc-40-like [Paramacrobiotus metropolitanus]|uniref:netrin receptor unc-40-like n=1 Tax=Paramacrobiotus metropolitanus TaxID=2943436 RepID=UPI002445E3CC|nr:netrin receptor unc-40-like [Paramacrobiotus metropolitanus]
MVKKSAFYSLFISAVNSLPEIRDPEVPFLSLIPFLAVFNMARAFNLTACENTRPLLKMQFPADVSYRLFWTAPVDNGSPIFRYKILYYPVSSPVERNELFTQGSATSVTLTGLLPETHYTVEITAENAFGSSPASTYTVFTGSRLTPTFPLARICNVAVLDQTATSVTFDFRWCDPLIETTSIEGRFTSQANSSQTFNKTWSANHPPFVLTGLQPGGSYTFKLRVRNRHGEGAVHSGIRSISQPPAGPPRAPVLLGPRNYYRLQWRPSVRAAGAEYGVECAGGEGAGRGTYAGVREYWDWNGAVPNATYNVVVTAKQGNASTGSGCVAVQNFTVLTGYHVPVVVP